MNRAFIQRDLRRPASAPAAIAAEGLAHLGYEIVWFDEADAGNLILNKECLVVGFIEVVRQAVEKLTGNKPPVFNYPDALAKFLGRRVQTTTLSKIINTPDMWPIFMKPAGEVKSFGGRVVKGVRNVIGLNDLPKDYAVQVSEVVPFLSEFRCFVQKGELLSCRQYKGDPIIFPDGEVINEMISAWTDAPAAYCLDVGVVKNERGELSTVLVEINDAYSAGTYGLDPLIYARFVETRWCEMTGAKPIP